MSASSANKIIQLSDCHLFADKAKCGYQEVNPYKTLARIVDDILNDAVIAAGNLILVTGDISGDDSKQSYHHFCSLMEPLLERNTLRVIPGNHDNNPHYSAVLSPWHLGADSPVTLGNWLVHGLDTRLSASTGAKGEVKANELTVIEQNIYNHATKHHLLALHHHPMVSNSWMDKHELQGSQQLVAWLEQQSAVCGAVHGHIHHPLRRTTSNKVTIAGAPSTAWQWAMTQAFGVTNESAGYQVITLHNNGTIDCEVRRTQ